MPVGHTLIYCRQKMLNEVYFHRIVVEKERPLPSGLVSSKLGGGGIFNYIFMFFLSISFEIDMLFLRSVNTNI